MKIGDKDRPLPYSYNRIQWAHYTKMIYDYKEDLKRRTETSDRNVKARLETEGGKQ